MSAQKALLAHKVIGLTAANFVQLHGKYNVDDSRSLVFISAAETPQLFEKYDLRGFNTSDHSVGFAA